MPSATRCRISSEHCSVRSRSSRLGAWRPPRRRGPVKREDWDRMYSKHEHLWSAKPNRMLVAEVGALRPGRALDLACGEGQNAVWLAGLGWDVLGIDFSEVAIAKARRRAAAEDVRAEF